MILFDWLYQESEAGNRAEKWILEAIKSMKAASPISLKISLKSVYIEGFLVITLLFLLI